MEVVSLCKKSLFNMPVQSKHQMLSICKQTRILFLLNSHLITGLQNVGTFAQNGVEVIKAA